MKITDVKINGITNPVGFSFDTIRCSWKVEQCSGKYRKWARIIVSGSPDFETVIYEKKGADLNSIDTVLSFEMKPRTTYYVQVEEEADNGEYAVSTPAFFETAKMDEPWTAKPVTVHKEDCFHPVFFKDFVIEKQIQKARLYVTGTGLYEAWLNQEKVGKDFLAPFITDYDTCIQYQTYDVTELLKGENRLQIFLGRGYYMGNIGYDGYHGVYGDHFTALAELHLEYSDGTEEIIGTDENWYYQGSDIEDSDIYNGEILNRCLWEEKDNTPRAAVEDTEFSMDRIQERYSLPVLVKEELPVVQVFKTPAGETVLDFGQNFTGYAEFKADFPKGTKIILDYGEILQNGNFYRENYRTAKSQFVYVSNGNKEVVRPHFTFFGFRYVRVSGWNGEVKASDFTGKVVYSDLSVTGSIETGHAGINRLFLNALWSQKSNFLDIPTDCPQRDERLGWTGDAQVFSPAAVYNMDCRAFYDKFLKDLRIEQQKWDGAVPIYVPNYNKMPGGCAVYSDIASFLPSLLYEFYGEPENLKKYYPMMKDWVLSVNRRDIENGEHNLFDFGMQFGDWLAMDGPTPTSKMGATDPFFISSVYYYASADMTAKAAKILGIEEDQKLFSDLAAKIRNAILEEYFTPNGRLSIDTQAGYTVALRFGVYRDKEKLIQQFRLRLKHDCYRIKGGFIGATSICQVLAAEGMADLAYRILLQEDCPSWLYAVNMGATTIWERWNSVLEDGTISPTGMNSLNHYAYGCVMEFLYKYAAGIQPLQSGFTKVRFAPILNVTLKHLTCRYESVSGTYISEWEILENGNIRCHFEVPYNCTAEIVLPGDSKETVILATAGVYDYEYTPVEDYRYPFREDTPLELIAQNKEALQIMQEMLPLAAGMAIGNDLDERNYTFEEIQTYQHMGFDRDMVQKTFARINKINVFYK